MRKALKLIVFLLVIVIAALIALPFIIDPNDYKSEISSQVEKVTGRKLILQGDIGLSVFPWIALELGPLSLSNAEGFKAETFAQVEEANIRIKLLPLLNKQLEMDTIVLDGLVLNLETDKDGKTNWEDLSKTDKDSAEESVTEQDKSSSPALSTINIAGVKLTNANILWSDASKDENFQLRNLNLNTDPLEPGKPTAVDMAFDVISTKPEAKAHVTLNAIATVDVEKQQYALDNLKFATIATGKSLPFSQADISLTGNVSADMEKQLVNVAGLVLNTKANNDKQTIDAKITANAINANLDKQLIDVADLVLNAKASAEQQTIDANLTANINANLASQQTTVNNLNLTAKITDPALPGKTADINVTSNVLADLQQQTLTVSALVLQLKELILEADIKANKILSDNPTFAGSAQVKPFNLRKLANDMKIELPAMADTSTLTAFALASEFEGSTNSFNAKYLDLTLDQSKLTGQFAINDFTKPAFNFALKLDQIDADRYLPPVQESTPEKSTPKTSETAKTEAGELPLDSLRQINAKGTLDIDKLKITDLISENIHITINADNGLVKMTPVKADIYKGKYSGNIILDARKDALLLSIDESIKNVQAGPLLQDMTNEAKISGTANLSIKMTGTGKTIDDIKNTLNGNGGFSFTDGAIQGINIAHLLRQAQATLKGQKLADTDEQAKTDFSSLAGTFTVKDGVIDNKDLDVKSPLLRISGAGKASLPEELIDYALKIAVVGTITGQGGADLSELKGLTIPIKVSGTFSNPKPSVDVAALLQDNFQQQIDAKQEELKAKAEEKVEAKKEELKTKAEEKLKNKLGDELGGLLGGALGINKATEQEAAPDSQTDPSTHTDNAPPVEEESNNDKKQLENAVKDKLKSFF